MVNKRISEIITTNEIREWKDGNIITISAGTGAGKSYFIKNVLYEYARKENKRILFLIHRINCVEQFKKEIERDNKQDIIDIKTYQYVENIKMNNKEIDFKKYKYIVCDEFHYFMSDSAFSKTTDISLNTIIGLNNHIRIFMSATGDYTKKYINKIKNISTIDYELPITYDFIKSLTFYNLDTTLDMFVEECIKSEDKAIFFIQSAKKAYELYLKYKNNCMFNCSKNNKDYYKYVDKDKLSDMLVNEKFKENILITTTCMDAGVNIIDEKVKHIVCDVEGFDTLIQCIGRKRIQNEDDKVYLYVKSISNKQLGGKETQLKNKIKMADYLRKHTVKEYIEEFPRSFDYNQIVYDETVEDENNCTKNINELMYFKCKNDLANIEVMKKYNKYGYNKYLANKLGFYDKENGFNYRIIEEENNKNGLELFLESIADEKLFKDEQKLLIEKIDLRVDGRQQKSYSKLNQGLEMLKLPYVILPKKSNGKRYWVVTKIEK